MNILSIKDLTVSFGDLKAVDNVSLSLERGETLGIVGESGSGKTLAALSIVRLLPPGSSVSSGPIIFEGRDISKAPEEDLRAIRGSKIAFVFQEPATAFNPVFTIGYQLEEALLAHGRISDRKAARQSVLDGLETVHIKDPLRIYHDYPHQLSGGTKQRAMIAMALLNRPDLLILDEPTTALDVTIQAGILDLLEEIVERQKLSMIFISHDFGVIARMCGRVAVMRNGRIVEMGKTRDIIRGPKEDYTATLLDSVKELL